MQAEAPADVHNSERTCLNPGWLQAQHGLHITGELTEQDGAIRAHNDVMRGKGHVNRLRMSRIWRVLHRQWSSSLRRHLLSIPSWRRKATFAAISFRTVPGDME
jgi:hypothetical protein